MLFGRAVNLDRGIFASFEEATLNSLVQLSKTTSNMLKLQSDLMRIHRKILEEGDETRLAADVTDDFTEFSNGPHVLLKPVTGPKDCLHTRRTGPYLVVESNNNNYTLKNLVSKKQLRVRINRIVPFLFDPLRMDPQTVTTHDVDEFHVEMILSYKTKF